MNRCEVCADWRTPWAIMLVCYKNKHWPSRGSAPAEKRGAGHGE